MKANVLHSSFYQISVYCIINKLEVRIMSIQDLQSDLLIDLSTEQQQDVSGGFHGLLGLGLGLGLGGKHGSHRGFFGGSPYGYGRSGVHRVGHRGFPGHGLGHGWLF
jgi:hypothetical protein